MRSVINKGALHTNHIKLHSYLKTIIKPTQKSSECKLQYQQFVKEFKHTLFIKRSLSYTHEYETIIKASVGHNNLITQSMCIQHMWRHLLFGRVKLFFFCRTAVRLCLHKAVSFVQALVLSSSNRWRFFSFYVLYCI